MKKKIILPVVALIAITFSACRKYEEGPTISFLSRENRVENSWYVEKYLVNGTDSSTLYTKNNMAEFYDLDGNFRTFYSKTTGLPLPVVVSGTWAFQNKDREICRTLTNGKTEVIEITRLKKNSFWYRMKRGNDLLEFHLTTDQLSLPD